MSLDEARTRARFDDGAVVVELSYPDFARRTLSSRSEGAREGHVVRLDRARALAALLDGLFDPKGVSPVTAAFLEAAPPPAA